MNQSTTPTGQPFCLRLDLPEHGGMLFDGRLIARSGFQHGGATLEGSISQRMAINNFWVEMLLFKTSGGSPAYVLVEESVLADPPDERAIYRADVETWADVFDDPSSLLRFLGNRSSEDADFDKLVGSIIQQARAADPDISNVLEQYHTSREFVGPRRHL